MKEENVILENPLGLSSESEDFLTPEIAEEILNENYAITDKLDIEPNLLVARAGLNEHGLWGYVCKIENGKWKSFGYTLEPTKNIPEKGYIPHGVYKFKRWDSSKLKKTLRLYSVPNFTNVLVHNIKKPTRLVSSRAITDYLYDNFSQGHIVVGWL